MHIIVNGQPQNCDAANLADALFELGYGGKTVATAVNGTFVAASARAATPLNKGDRIEILAPMQGG